MRVWAKFRDWPKRTEIPLLIKSSTSKVIRPKNENVPCVTLTMMSKQALVVSLFHNTALEFEDERIPPSQFSMLLTNIISHYSVLARSMSMWLC